MPWLVITDGVTRINLHTDNGLYLRNWQPGRAADKKVRREPVFAGGQVVINDYGNVTDAFEIGLRAHCQDNIIAMLQDLDRLLQKAINYWASTWTWEPVWLEARGPEETGTRYAVIRDYAIDGMANPYAQPFFTSFGMGNMNNLTMAIEHDIWQADEPGTATCVQLYHSESIDAPAEEGAIVHASAEDAYTDENTAGAGTIDVGGNNLLMGADATPDSLDTGLLFFDVDVPQNATIMAAYVMLYANANTNNTTCNLRIYGDTNVGGAAPANFTTYVDFWARPRTTAYVDWDNVGAWVNTNYYYTPNIAPVVQEIVLLGGWASGQRMGIFIQNNSSDTGAYRQAGSFDDGDPVYLYVIYKSGAITAGIAASGATCSDYNYITNYHASTFHTSAEGITHAYHYNGAVWSSNLLTAALPANLFPNPVVNGSFLYIGAVDTALGPLDDKNVFTNVVFDVGAAAAYTAPASTTWTYWNGAAWAGLTFYDATSQTTANTSAFSATGVNSLHFNLPSNWTATVVNGVPGYWIRCEVTIAGGGAITVPTQANRDIYACRWACVDIDDEQVLGDIPALAKLMVHARSDDSSVDRLPAEHCQVIMGLRTEERGTWALDRGPIFQAYLPVASDMRCRGQSHNYYSVGGSFATAEAADYRSPYGGLSAQYTSVTSHTMQRFYMAEINYPTAGDFLGTYHMFVRYCQTTGSDGDLRMGYRVGASASTTIAKSVILRQSSNIEVADFGRVTIGGDVFGRDAEESIFLYLHLHMECTVAAAVNCYVYDIILIPADEWYAKITVDGETGDVADDDLYLDVDSATTPKDRRKAVVRDIEAIDGYYKIRYPWTWQGAGPAILQPNRTQRVWFLSFQATTLGPPPTGDLVAPFPLSASVRAEATARYLSMRGAR